jgi:NitT/TauT family transport system ATP-binding protein
MTTASAPGVLTTRRLSVGYNGRAVCSVPDLDLAPGTIWLVTGPNGAGKTTLLKTLAGLLPAVAGSIAPTPQPGRGGCVYVHSSPVIFRGSLRHNLHLGDRHADAIASAAAEFGLSDRLEQPARELSHGLRQRAAMARAILAHPAVLLLDEPEGGLDASALAVWQSFAARVVRERQFTLVVAAHRPAGLQGLPMTEIQLTT